MRDTFKRGSFMRENLKFRIAPRSTRRPKTGHRVVPTVVTLVVVAVCAIVYGSQAASVRSAETQIPAHVAETREMILAAVRAASIDELAPVFDASQSKTDIGSSAGDERGGDPISALKKRSADGRGHEILAALANVLDVAPATLPLGKDLENNLIYVWPYLAERPIETLTSAEEIDLYRLVPAAKVAEMREKKRWLWWRLVIGADGSWLMFKIAE